MNWANGEYQPKQKRADESKNRIIDAALALFADQGYHGTTAKTIAARAGVAVGSFYRYFQDKKAAFMAVCQRMEEELGDRIFEFGRQAREQGRSEQEILSLLIEFAVTGHHRNKAFHREVLAMQIMDPDVAAWTKAREERMLATLHAFLNPIRAGLRVHDLKAAVELVYYTIEEVAHRTVLFDSPVGEKRLVRELQNMLEKYLF